MSIISPIIRWQRTHHTIIIVVLIAIVVGGASGAVGELLTRGWILRALTDNQQLTELNNQFYTLLNKYQLISASDTQPLEIVIRRASESTGLQVVTRVVSGGVIENARQATVWFYPTRTATGTDPLTAAYQPDDQLGQGVIITNDGWIVTTRQVLSRAAGQVVVTAAGETLSVVKLVSDPSTEFVFVKVAAANLPVASLAKTVPVLGSGGFSITDAQGLSISTVTDQHVRPSARPAYHSERFDEYVRLTESTTVAGTPIFDDQGIVQGLTVIVNGQPIIRPLAAVAPQVDQVFKNGVIARPALGVDYVLLDQLAFPPSVTLPYQSLRRGALVYRNARLNLAGVAVNSAAAAATLQAGDVILKVDGVEVTRNRPLTDIVQTYQPGDDITLTIWREGTEQALTATLQAAQE